MITIEQLYTMSTYIIHMHERTHARTQLYISLDISDPFLNLMMIITLIDN